jgi:hypothetical protein
MDMPALNLILITILELVQMSLSRRLYCTGKGTALGLPPCHLETQDR